MNIQTLPKALLHDHLDGGLRPATVIELANEYGYTKLPTTDVDELAAWFNRGAKRNDLVLYLETFAHTVGVMQHRDAIERVSYECAVDLAADGVVYAEVRMAPELCTEAGLTLDEAVEAMLAGFRRGSAGTDLTIYLILSAMRTAARSREIAELAVRWRDEGVVGFDIAGAEEGFPRLVTSTRSSTSAARTSTPPSTPARRSGCPASGRPCSSAAQSVSATACASSTTSSARRAMRSSAAWPRSSATAASRWSCARPRTWAPVCARPSPSIPSACSAACDSVSRSTPTTG